MKQAPQKWVNKAVIVVITAAVLFLGQGAVRTVLILNDLLQPLREAQ